MGGDWVGGPELLTAGAKACRGLGRVKTEEDAWED